jgi:arabinan endo-1,5-alpha-L-arabinosidase
MKSRILAATALTLFSLWMSSQAQALNGKPYIHDPSTVILCDGKYYTFGTGGGRAGLCVPAEGWPPTSSTSGIASM